MRRRLLLIGLLIALSPSWVGTARAEEREVMLFRPAAGGFALDDARLTEAVRIYTRHLSVRGAGRRGRLWLWYVGSTEPNGDVVVDLYVRPEGQEAQGTAVVQLRGPRDDNLYRALALKVRAVMAGDPDIERVPGPPDELVLSPVSAPATTGAAPAPPPTTASAPLPTTAAGPPLSAATGARGPASRLATGRAATSTPAAVPAAAGGRATIPAARGGVRVAAEAPAPRPLPATPVPASPAALPAPPTIAAPAAAPRRWGIGIEGAPRLALSDGTNVAHFGGTLTLTVPVHRLIEATIGFAADTPHAVDDGGEHAQAAIWPVHVGARYMRQRGRFETGAGLRLGAAVFKATGRRSSDGAQDSAFGASFLVGADALVRFRLYRNLALFAETTLDLLPSPFRLRSNDGPWTLDTGYLLGGLAVGAAATFP